MGSFGVQASTFSTTTTTGYTSTGYYEQTVYDLEWDMLWFDNNGWKPPLSLNDVIVNGIAWAKKSILTLAGNDYGTIYRLDLPDILDANNVEIVLNGFNGAGSDALAGYDFHIYAQGTSGNAEVNFIGSPSLMAFSKLAAGNTLVYND